jgi:hypothetical protein
MRWRLSLRSSSSSGGDNDHLLKLLGYSHRGTYAAWDGGRRLSPALASDLDFVLIILPYNGHILALGFEG